MKSKNVLLILGLLLPVLLGMGYTLSHSSYLMGQSAAGLVLHIQSDKKNYLPGEMVSLRLSMINKSNATVSLYKGSTVQDGNLKVFISYNGGAFKEYFGPGWGTKDAVYREQIRLAPEESFTTEATVLWNQKIETSHLNNMYAKKIGKDRIKTDYALGEPGVYYIKAMLHDPLTNNTIESEAISVSVEEPQGADLETWNKLKEDGKYGFFIQTGGLAEHPKGSKTTAIVNALESLLALHPESQYAGEIRSSLSKRRSLLERIERKISGSPTN